MIKIFSKALQAGHLYPHRISSLPLFSFSRTGSFSPLPNAFHRHAPPGTARCLSLNGASCASPTSSAPASFQAFNIDANGDADTDIFTKTALLNDARLHGRDIITLLSGQAMRRSRPDILVRDKSIVVCFSHIRAIIQHNRLLLFNPENESVKSLVPRLSNAISQKHSNGPHPFDYLSDVPDFEMRALEGILSEVCDTYQRRAAIIAPLVDRVLQNLSTSKQLTDSLQELLPMKDNLSNFEIETGKAKDVLNALLKNEEDMVSLLLNERRRRFGKLPPLEAHKNVEIMLENYCSRLVDINQEVYFLRKRVESIQSVVELKLNSHRNRLLLFSLQLSMASVSIGFTTAMVRRI